MPSRLFATKSRECIAIKNAFINLCSDACTMFCSVAFINFCSDAFTMFFRVACLNICSDACNTMFCSVAFMNFCSDACRILLLLFISFYYYFIAIGHTRVRMTNCASILTFFYVTCVFSLTPPPPSFPRREAGIPDVMMS